ncbi:MAG: hypothetical protein JO212_09160, partial [Acetobacteraceae bacterium]|nr:hypothetical protein [Acetobacteraceae bacterium]
IEIIKRELAVDVLEFFCLTPLPGSEDHQILWKSGAAMDPDLNKYDAEHVCAAHPRMSTEEWEAVYQEAWSLYYTPEHIKMLMRRAAATGVPMRSLATVLLAFSMAVRLENVHPLQSGILRLKHPSERRPGLPRVNPWVFWPAFAWQTLRKHAILARTIWHFVQLKRAIECDPAARDYMDYALAPEYDDDESLDLLTKTSGPIAASVRTRPTMAGSSL